MAMSDGSTVRLQAEVDRQRQKLSADIDRLAERLTPGRLVDELLARTKDNGGAFFANLGRSATANPVPVALLGVSLAWLMAKGPDGADDRGAEGSTAYPGKATSVPMATVSGRTIRRVGHGPDESGEAWSSFADESGRTFRAKSDSLGRRAGHFLDEAGNSYRGFVDNAGEQIRSFQDEAGVALDDVAGWASATWSATGDAISGAVRSGADSVAQGTSDASRAISDGAKRLNDIAASSFRSQPLIGAALAFAAGAALAATLPHTDTEDELVGKSADEVKDMAAGEAEDAYGVAKEKVSEVYAKATEAVAPSAEGQRQS